jgi:hypothetical protein
VLRKSALLTAMLLGCGHARPPGAQAAVARGDCAELLRGADAARADRDLELASELASACPPAKLMKLVEAAPPAEALLWCGRAAAGRNGCDPKVVGALAARLNPRLTLGPPDEGTPEDPLLASAIGQLGKDLNLSWDAEDPDVVVGKLVVTVDHVTGSTSALVANARGKEQRVAATQHRFVARAEAQVDLAGKTRTLRAVEEARDTTWDASPTLLVAAKFEPSVPPAEELKKRAVLSWLRTLAKALAAAPPEAVDVTDEKGCVAYGLSLNLTSGDPAAARNGAGEPARIAACEKLLGEPAGAGIPVP